MFMDDLVAVVTSEAPETALDEAQAVVWAVERWCTEHGMILSPGKTVAQWYDFSADREPAPDETLSLSDSREVDLPPAWTATQAVGKLKHKGVWTDQHPGCAGPLRFRDDSRLPPALAGAHILDVGGAAVPDAFDQGGESPAAWFRRHFVRGVRVTVISSVPWAPDPKYLGVFVPATLNWDRHIAHMETRHRQRLGILRKFAGDSWGSTSDMLRVLYLAYVFPVLTYACGAWGPYLSTAQWDRLVALQSTAARQITGLTAWTRDAVVLLREAGIPDIRDHAAAAAVQLAICKSLFLDPRRVVICYSLKENPVPLQPQA